MANYVTNTSDKNKNTAMLMCIFGGIFGLHHFYVGNIGKGLLYIFTGGLFCIGWFGDILKIATGSFRDSAGAPLRANKKDYNDNQNNQNISVNVNVPNQASSVDVSEQLQRLADLRDKGTLTEEEFQTQKAKLLS